MRTQILSFTLVCLLAACTATGQRQPEAAVAASNGVVATVDGFAITEEALGVEGQLLQLKQQAHDVKMKALEEAVAERLIEVEAEKQGITVEELTAKEVDSKISEPTDADIEGFYEAQKARIRAPLEQVRPQVRQLLLSMQEQQAREAFVNSLREQSDVAILLEPVRFPVELDGAPMQGPEDAPITIVEFSDFQCPFCRRVQPTLARVQQKYGDKIRWSFKDLPLLSIHPEAQKAAEAARCAGDQGKFWEYRAAMFDSTTINAELHTKTAESLGLDQDEFSSCLETDKHADAVAADLKEASGLGLSGTPAFLINGVMLSGAQPYEAFEKVIEQELAQAE